MKRLPHFRPEPVAPPAKPKWPWILVAAAIAIAGQTAVTVYPRLPERVACHFDASGLADGWMSKAMFVGLMFGGLALVTLLTSAMTLLTRRLPKRLISLPYKEYWLAPEREGETRAVLQQYAAWLMVVSTCFFAALVHQSLEANLHQPAQLEYVEMMLVAYLLATMGLTFSLVQRFSDKPQEEEEEEDDGEFEA